MHGKGIVKFIRSQRLRWLGHVERMPEERMPKGMLKGRLHTTRRRGRPRMRWLGGITEELLAWESEGGEEGQRTGTVSYTHLDVYKRQMKGCRPLK